MLMVGTLVGILKPAPSADVIDEDRLEVGPTGLDLGHEVLQRITAVEA